MNSEERIANFIVGMMFVSGALLFYFLGFLSMYTGIKEGNIPCPSSTLQETIE